jgi:hypothetical protein
VSIEPLLDRAGHRLTQVCLVDYRGSRFDGYVLAMAAVLLIGIGVIYL